MIPKLIRKREQIRHTIVLLAIAFATFKSEAAGLLREMFGTSVRIPIIGIDLELGTAPTFLVFVIVLSIYVGLEIAIHFSIDKFRIFRTWLMKEQDIEDDWLELVYKDRVPHYAGWVRIEYDHVMSSYKISGEIYTLDGIQIGTFSSEFGYFSGSVLSFVYITRNQNDNPQLISSGVTGNSYLNFNPSLSEENKAYHGIFYDNTSSSAFETQGERVHEFLAKIRDSERICVLEGKYLGLERDYFSSLKSQIKELIKRKHIQIMPRYPFFSVHQYNPTSVARGKVVRQYVSWKSFYQASSELES